MSYKRVSLKDIAKELGVSKSLVSFVMNGRAKEMRVSDVMTEKILSKAKEMGYRANPLAQSLRTGKTHTIGLIVADISNQFYSKIARSVEDEAYLNNYYVIFGSSDESDQRSSELIDLFYSKKIDGLIISPTKGDQKKIVKLQRSGFPIVLLDRYFSNNKNNVVVANNISGSYEIVKRLIENGSKKIGYITHRTNSSVVHHRYLGYKRAINEYGIKLDNEIIREVNHINNEKEVKFAVNDLVKNYNVDAIFFFNNTLAIEGGKVLAEFNKKSKFNIVIGCFDSSRYLELFDIPFVSAVQQVEKLGKVSMSLLLKQIKSEKQLNEKRILNANLIDRLN